MPTEEVKKNLADYLLTATPAPDVTVAVVSEPPPPALPITPVEAIPVEIFPDAEMMDLMAKIKRIGMCAKDLHYRAKGKPFYGLHQLSDLVWQIEQDTDDIAEIYFMGDRQKEPPRMDEVFAMALALPIVYPADDRYFVGGLLNICLATMNTIEAIKKAFPDKIKSGVAAVLDKISEHCLLSIGLLDQTMKGA